MLSRFVRTGAMLAIGSALVLLTASACGGAGKTASAAKEAPPANVAASTGAATAITIVGLDNKWDQPNLAAPAGSEVMLTLQNKGQAIHNWRVMGVKGNDGKDIGTQLLAGGKSETITFAIEKPGTYDFICDVHPVEMKGKITVQ